MSRRDGYVQGDVSRGGFGCFQGYSYHVTYPMMHVMLPTPSCGQRDTCEPPLQALIKKKIND